MKQLDDLKIRNYKVTLVDQVEEKLLEYFKTGKFRPGDPIPNEHELAEALGVGRSVLREALSRLRMLGFVETRTRRGMIITEPSLFGGLKRVAEPVLLSEETLFDLLGFRISLEVGIIELLFQNLNERHIRELDEIVNRGVVLSDGQYSPVSEFEFHAKLYEITGNESIIEFQNVIRPVSVFITEKYKEYFLPEKQKIEKTGGKRITHMDLLGLLKKRNKKGFRKAMILHFALYYKFLKKNLNA